MIEDMAARELGPQSQRSHVYSCKRFAAFLKRSPDTATAPPCREVGHHCRCHGINTITIGTSLVACCGAILLEQNDEWAVTRRYVSLETMAGLCNDPTVGTKAIPAT